MLGDGILETTTTTGTGDLTTSAVTGRPRITDYFTANATEASADHFYYSILTQDSTPQILETGIGYMSATGTLKRIVPLTTYSSGTLTKNSASVSALSLSSGTKNVIVTAMHSSGHGLAMPGMDNQNSMVRYSFGANMPFQILSGSTTATANRLYVLPHLLISARVIDAIVFRIAAGSSSGNVRVGLYGVNRDGSPGRKLAGSTADQVVSAGTWYAITTGLPLLLPPGWYYTAIVADAAVLINNLGTYSIMPSPLGFDSSNNSPNVWAYVANGSTTLPDPMSAFAGKSSNAPMTCGLRFAA